jgi:hypothetical protein
MSMVVCVVEGGTNGVLTYAAPAQISADTSQHDVLCCGDGEDEKSSDPGSHEANCTSIHSRREQHRGTCDISMNDVMIWVRINLCLTYSRIHHFSIFDTIQLRSTLERPTYMKRTVSLHYRRYNVNSSIVSSLPSSPSL